MRFPRILRALASRNYRLFFTGQMVSLVGTWMTQTASLWLIYHLSASAFLLGVLGFASQVPIFLIAPFAGVWIDRVNRHRLLVGTQIAAMLQSLALAFFALTNTISVHHLLVLGLIQGVINAFDMPARQALVLEFVEKRENLGNAIALNSSMFNLSRLIGPALGGFVIAGFGAGACYLIDAISYLAVIASLMAMRYHPVPSSVPRRHPFVELKEGFQYAFGFIPIRALILMVGWVSFAGFSYLVLMPVFARDIFHGGAQILGLFMSASGLGALAAAFYLSARTSVRGLGRVISVGSVLMGAGLIGFSISRFLFLSILCLAAVGMGGVLLMASSNTLLQTMSEDTKRGRVMSFFAMAFTGMTPLGNLVAGSVASAVGSVAALSVGGVSCLIAGAIFYRKLPRLREEAAPLIARMEVEQTQLPPS